MTTPDQLAAIEARANDPFGTSLQGIGQVDADRDALIALVREQAAALKAVDELTREWEAIGKGNSSFDSALRVCAYKARAAIRAALTATEGSE